MENMSLDEVMAVLSPEEQANLGGIIDGAGSCWHCVKNTVTAMRNACEFLKWYSLLWHLAENHPEDPNQAEKMNVCETKRNYIIRIDEAFYTAQMQGICNPCKEGILSARDLWTQTKKIWEEFDAMSFEELDAMSF